MTPKQIREVLGIDIATDKRTLQYVYVKNIYANQERLKSHPLRKIAFDLNLTHGTVSISLSRTKLYAKMPAYIAIKKAYLTKDRDLFDRTVELLLDCTYAIKRVPNKQSRKKQAKPKERWHSSKISETLRPYPTHRLWNIPMNEYTKADYVLLAALRVETHQKGQL